MTLMQLGIPFRVDKEKKSGSQSTSKMIEYFLLAKKNKNTNCNKKQRFKEHLSTKLAVFIAGTFAFTNTSFKATRVHNSNKYPTVYI